MHARVVINQDERYIELKTLICDACIVTGMMGVAHLVQRRTRDPKTRGSNRQSQEQLKVVSFSDSKMLC